MSRRQSIDRILADWAYDPGTVNVRVVRADDDREVIQMRIDMGLLQLETTGRPDGDRPFGYETYCDYLVSCAFRDNGFELSEEQCLEVDREFVQFYHRRMCWLTLRKYSRAVADADHTLVLLDFCADHSSDEEWTMSHEQYRPFVLFHRIQATALEQLDRQSAEAAVHTLNVGLDQLRESVRPARCRGNVRRERIGSAAERDARVVARPVPGGTHLGGTTAGCRRRANSTNWRPNSATNSSGGRRDCTADAACTRSRSRLGLRPDPRKCPTSCASHERRLYAAHRRPASVSEAGTAGLSSLTPRFMNKGAAVTARQLAGWRGCAPDRSGRRGPVGRPNGC